MKEVVVCFPGCQGSASMPYRSIPFYFKPGVNILSLVLHRSTATTVIILFCSIDSVYCLIYFILQFLFVFSILLWKHILHVCRLPVAILRTLLQELLNVVDVDDLNLVPNFTELKPEARFAILLYHRWYMLFTCVAYAFNALSLSSLLCSS